MRYGYVKLRPGERPGEGRVRVAVHQEPVGPLLDRDRLDAFEHRGRLRTVRSRADAEIYVGCRQSQLREEQFRHRLVVMLAGVDQELVMAIPHRARDWPGLDELRPGAEHGEDPHR